MAKRTAQEVFPLTPLQRGMLFHSLGEPESGAYVEQCRFVLDGLDPALFRRAWELVVGCYPAPATEGAPETGQPPVAPESTGDRET